MEIALIGATGLIGSSVYKYLKEEHKVLKVGNTRGDDQVNLSSLESIENLFQRIGNVDAIISCAGLANFGGAFDLTLKDFELGLNNKLMGQVHLCRVGVNYLNDGGSICLTSGELSQNPIPGSSLISMVNAGLEAYVKALALEMPNGKRVNVVCPPFMKETMEMMKMDSTYGFPVKSVGPSYKAAISTNINGEILHPKNYS